MEFLTTLRKTVPFYDLYGEAHSAPLRDFLHVETIQHRARSHAWTILAHRHGGLSQILHISAGGGVSTIDGQDVAIEAPAIIWLPAGAVHGFRFTPDTDGAVLTVASAFLSRAMEDAPGLPHRLRSACALSRLENDVEAAMADQIAAISREAASTAPEARAATRHHLALLLIALARRAAPRMVHPPSSAALLLAAFRTMVDAHYRDNWAIPDYAKALSSSVDRLHEACRTAAGRPPGKIVQDRLMIEAQRALLYTSKTVSDIAFDLGFDDPAYFSRFFRKRAGCSPVSFRGKAGHGDESWRAGNPAASL